MIKTIQTHEIRRRVTTNELPNYVRRKSGKNVKINSPPAIVYTCEVRYGRFSSGRDNVVPPGSADIRTLNDTHCLRTRRLLHLVEGNGIHLDG